MTNLVAAGFIEPLPSAICEGAPSLDPASGSSAKSRDARLVTERRNESRKPFPYPLMLTPVDPKSLEPQGASFVVLGKHLAECGVDFYTPGPLSLRYLLVEFDLASGGQARFLLEVTWCRFNKFGLYENGGRFLKPLPPRANDDLPALSGEIANNGNAAPTVA